MTTRRRFLTRTTAALAAPFILPSRRALAAEARGHSIRLGHLGVGGQGSALLRPLRTLPILVRGLQLNGQRRYCTPMLLHCRMPASMRTLPSCGNA